MTRRRGRDGRDALFERIAGFGPLTEAARAAARGKRAKPGAAAFLADLEKEVLRLERELRSGRYRPGRYKKIEIREPKRRTVSAAPFRDRVVHHALHAAVAPLFERGFVRDSYANRTGKGTHRAVARYEAFRDRFRHVLRADVYRYFPSIDHAILKGDLRRRLSCGRTLRLCDAVVDGSNPQEPVNLYFPGDDLFAPHARRRGLPVGNLTSQFFANVYLDRLDHFCKEVLRAKGYLRYVDDFALFHDDPERLEEWRRRIAAFLEGRRLRLHPVKTFAAPADAPAAFLGFVLLPRRAPAPAGGERAPLPQPPAGPARPLAGGGRRTRRRSGRRVESWAAHAGHADTWRLRRAIFRRGWFDPALEPGGSPAPFAFSAAAPGTTNRGTSARRTATGTGPANGTTTTGSASPARSSARAAAATAGRGGARERPGPAMTTSPPRRHRGGARHGPSAPGAAPPRAGGGQGLPLPEKSGHDDAGKRGSEPNGARRPPAGFQGSAGSVLSHDKCRARAEPRRRGPLSLLRERVRVRVEQEILHAVRPRPGTNAADETGGIANNGDVSETIVCALLTRPLCRSHFSRKAVPNGGGVRVADRDRAGGRWPAARGDPGLAGGHGVWRLRRRSEGRGRSLDPAGFGRPARTRRGGPRTRESRSSPHERLAVDAGARRSRGLASDRPGHRASIRPARCPGVSRMAVFRVCLLRDREEIGPRMLVRIAKRTGLSPGNP